MLLRWMTLCLRWAYTRLVHLAFKATWRVWPSTAPPLPVVTDPVLVQPSHVLAAWIRQGKVSSEQVVQAYVERSGVVNPRINAVVDQRWAEALEEARAVDQLLAGMSQNDRSHLKMSRPLLGVPFSCKENIRIKGMSHAGGLVARIGMKAHEDAQVVVHLRKAGAIPMCVTNVPELGNWWESDSRVYGRTSSPYDTSRTSGGSSGGESALLSSCGTPLSIGTDVGGSVRVPAYFCGTFAHKPTPGWVSLKGAGLYDQKLDKGNILVAGPMCRHAQDLPFLMEVLAPQHAHDIQQRVADVKIDHLKIWWAEGLGPSAWYSTVDLRLKKAVHDVVRYLTVNKGAKSEKWNVNMADAYDVWLDKAAEDYRGEPKVTVDMADRTGEKSLLWEMMLWMVGRGRHTLPTFTWALMYEGTVLHTKLFGRPTVSPHCWSTRKQEFVNALGENGVLVMPTLPMVAPFHNEPLFHWYDCSFTGIANALELPSTQASLGLDSKGQPIGLQVIAAPGNDHLSMAVAIALEEKYGGWVCPGELKLPSK